MGTGPFLAPESFRQKGTCPALSPFFGLFFGLIKTLSSLRR